MDSTAEGEPRALWCASLLERLRLEGFDIGVGQVLLIERLLDRIGPEPPISGLRSVLCPIVARNPEEQRRFYEVFAEYLAPAAVRKLVEESPPEGPVPPIDHRDPKTRIKEVPVVPLWQRRGLRLGTALVAVIIALVVLNRINPDVDTPPLPSPVPPPSQPPIDTTTGTSPEVVPGVVKPLDILPPPEPATGRDWRFLRFGAAGLPLVMLGWFAWRRRRRQDAVAERESRATAPYVWPIRIPATTTALYPVSDFAASSRVLRRRQESSEVKFSAERTIGATIRAAGFPTIRFEPMTRPSEYVALIERTSRRDHQAMFFDGLVQRLAAEGVFITPYFFEHDPRVCFTEESTRGVRLAELARMREGDRLLVFADGYSFLHPLRGTPLPWLELLEAWTDRALLTPVPPRHWGRREAVLRRCFDILPATLEGIRAAADHFEIRTRPDLSRWKERDRSEAQLRVGPASEVGELRNALGDDLFRWVAACAAYPELHWDLTALLGGLSEVGTGVLSERNVLRLIRLPWFRDGIMPAELQKALLDELARMDQATGIDTERAVRQTIVRVLEQEQVQPRSVAGLARRRELLQQHLYLYLEKPAAGQRAIDQLEKEMSTEEMLQDVTVVRLLERATANKLSFRLPEWFRRWLWRGGIPGLGLTRMAAAGVASAAIVGVLALIPGPSPPPAGPRATVYPELLAIAGPVDGRIPIAAAMIEPVDTGGAEWISSDSSVARVDTAGGEMEVRLVGPGSTEVRPGPGSAGVPIRVQVNDGSGRVSQSATPSSGFLRLDRMMRAGTRSSATTRWGTGRIVSCAPEVAGVVGDQSVRALAPGSAILVDGPEGAGAVGIRVLHVIDAADSLERIVEDPIDRWPEIPTSLYDSVMRNKARVFAELLARDTTARLAVTFHLVGERYASQENRNVTLTTTPGREGALHSLLTAGGVPADRLDLSSQQSGLSCYGRSFGPAVRDGDLDRVDIAVLRGAAGGGSDVVTISLDPPALVLNVGDSAQIGLRRTDGRARRRVEITPMWRSSAPLIASVSQSGVVRAGRPGSATVTVSLGDASARAEVRVRDPIVVVEPVVPALTGRSIAQAERLLRQVDLVLGVVDTTVLRSCRQTPAGIVASNPTAGSRLPRGSRVAVRWSEGRDATTRVPDLVGVLLSDARQLVADACLTLRIIDSALLEDRSNRAKQAPAGARAGVIGQQQPPAGTITKIGTVVSVRGAVGIPAGSSDRAFATRVYRDLGLSDSLGVERAVNELEKGRPRIDLLRELAGSRELYSTQRDQLIRRLFRAVVCRDPSDSEVKDLLGKFGGEGPSPVEIVDAVLASEAGRLARASCIGSEARARSQ